MIRPPPAPPPRWCAATSTTPPPRSAARRASFTASRRDNCDAVPLLYPDDCGARGLRFGPRAAVRRRAVDGMAGGGNDREAIPGSPVASASRLLRQAASQLALALDRHPGRSVAVEHRTLILEPVLLAESLDATRERFGVVARCVAVALIGAVVLRHQLWEVLSQHGEKAIADGGVEPQRPRVNEPRPGALRGGEQRLEMHDVVRDTWKDRRDDQSRVDTRFHELAQRPEPRRRNGRARFELSGQCGVVRDQRDMDLELVPLLQAHEQIAVARDQRALGDDTKGKTFTARQALQHSARDPKAAFSGLGGIRRRADHDAVAEWRMLEIGVKRPDHLFFDEDPRFERLPPVGAAVIGELGVGEFAGVVRALDDVAMRVARIAVTAAEFAADVGIERPILHPRCGGRVEDALGCERNETGATEALVEEGVGQSDGLTVGL